MKNYIIEIDIKDYGLTRDDSPYWVGADILTAEGHNLSSLLDSAEVWWRGWVF